MNRHLLRLLPLGPAAITALGIASVRPLDALYGRPTAEPAEGIAVSVRVHVPHPAALAPASAMPGEAAGAIDSPEREVRDALQHYLQGHATGDPEHFRQIFHPEAKLFSVRDGQLAQRTSAEYIAGVSGRPAADEAQRRRSIEHVDVAGDAAIARIVLDYPRARYVDYMSLLRVNGEWKIVNKTFHMEPRQASR